MNRNLLKLFLVFLYVIIACGIYLYINGGYFTGIDDANIYMVYMRNFATGHGFVYTIGGERVEGFTSLLWTIIGTPPYLILKEPDIYLLLVNVLIITFTLWRLVCFIDEYFNDKRLVSPGSLFVLIALLVTPGYFDWTLVALLETGLWSCLLINISLLLCSWEIRESQDKNNLLFGLLLVLLIPTRPESYLWGLIFLAIRTWQNLRVKGFNLQRALKLNLPFYIAFICGLLALTLWRLYYFGYPLPNTYYAKINPDRLQNIMDGLYYDLYYIYSFNPSALIIIFLAFLSIALMFRKVIKANNVLIILTVVLGITYLVPLYTGGDHFGAGRFIQPTNPLIWFFLLVSLKVIFDIQLKPVHQYYLVFGFSFLLCVMPGKRNFFENALGFFPGPNDTYEKSGYNGIIGHEFDLAVNGRTTSEKLNSFFNQLDTLPSQGVYAAGGAAYTYAGKTIDLLGLNNTKMAHAKKDLPRKFKNHDGFNKNIFFDQKPDLFWASSQFHDKSRIISYADFDFGEFYETLFKSVNNDPRFNEQYKKVTIFKKGEDACLSIYAHKEFLKKLDKNESYQYSIITKVQ